MSDDILFALTVVAALGCGLIGGVFFAFSALVMPALARLPAAQGIAAMQSINLVAVTPPLMVAPFGTALACLPLVVAALVGWGEPGAAWRLGGGLLYLAGAILVTIVGNVPRNNALAAVDPATAEGAAVWGRFVPAWSALNTGRAAASLAAAVAFALALASR